MAESFGSGQGRLERVLRPLRFAVGLVLFALVLGATVASWDDVRPALGRLSPLSVVIAEMFVLLGLAASVLTWRLALRAFGARVRTAVAAKIYLIGQLGKYAPGSVWALAVQMGLASRAGVSAVAALAASVIAIGANLATGFALGAFLVPTAIGGGIWRIVAVLVLLAAFAVVLSPPVLTRLLGLVKRRLGGGDMPGGMTRAGALRVLAWSLASWLFYGLSVWVLAIGVDAPPFEALLLSLSGAALAMTLGFVVVLAPSGIGVREAVIVAALSPALDHAEALAVALAARLVFTAADLLAAAAVLGVRISPRSAAGVTMTPPVTLREEDVEAFNDALARMYPIDAYYESASPPIRWVERRRLAAVRELVGNVQGLAVAEVGSGGGHVLRMFPEGQLTAIDVSGVYLEVARKNLAGYDVRFLKGEIEKLDLPEGSFDRVICSEVLEHVIDPDAVLGAMARLLRPEGVAVVTVPNDPLIHRVKALVRWIPIGWFARERLDWGGDAYHLHHWQPAEFERLLARHFAVLERRAIPFRILPLRCAFKCTARRHVRQAATVQAGRPTSSA